MNPRRIWGLALIPVTFPSSPLLSSPSTPCQMPEDQAEWLGGNFGDPKWLTVYTHEHARRSVKHSQIHHGLLPPGLFMATAKGGPDIGVPHRARKGPPSLHKRPTRAEAEFFRAVCIRRPEDSVSSPIIDCAASKRSFLSCSRPSVA